MKRLLTALLLLLAPGAWAAGPILRHEDTLIQQEFENVYKDIIAAGAAVDTSTMTVSSFTATNASIAAITNLTSINGTLIGMWHSRAINGEMAIDQANGGASVTNNSNTNKYSVDMWQAQGEPADGVFTMQRITTTPPAGFRYSIRTTVTTADASIGAAQSYFLLYTFEGYSLSDFSFGTSDAKQLTLSFYVRSSQTGTYSGAFLNGATNRSYPFTYVVDAANTWERESVTFTADTTGTWATDNTAGLLVYFDIGSGSTFQGTANAWAAATTVAVTGATKLISTLNATLDITGFQLERGPVASSFEFRPYPLELMMAQRYFETSYPLDVAFGTASADTGERISLTQTNTTTMQGNIYFKVRKRIAPTCTSYRGDDGTVNSWACRNTANTDTNRTVSLQEPTLGRVTLVQTAAVEYQCRGHYIADSRL